MTRRWPVDAARVLGQPDSTHHEVGAAALSVEAYAGDHAPTRGQILERAAGAGALITSVADQVDASLLDALPALRVVAQAAVGYDNVDVRACAERGIRVTHTPDVLTESTADLAMALLLSLARHLREGEELLRSGGFQGWSPTMLLGMELAGKRCGVIGYGRIGRAFARRAAAFGMEVVYCTRADREPDAAQQTECVSAKWVSFAELLATSRVVSVHVPGSARTRHLLGAAELAQMPVGALLLNTARGSVVDEAALVHSLQRRHLGGAGLDVYEDEPRVHPGLLHRSDVVLLPHLGSATREARGRMATLALTDAARVLRGGSPLHLVPELDEAGPWR